MSHPRKPSKAPEEKHPPLVFLVDDQEVLLDLAEAALQGLKVAVRKFADPEAALKEFARTRPKPDLLITDYAMGKMNGLDLIRRCQKLHRPLKSVILSGTAGAEILIGAPVQVDQFLSKPYPYEQLAPLVRRLLHL